ncbi:hypothetical protein ACEZCY_17460 [Streptacidiphilus sp. N1-12]|uniref:Uncharacterized protein n=2 Tax=Streptacidiphilus alkalitolerans TaxID=3342712 RepID=A0ABV6X151_9ACTN
MDSWDDYLAPGDGDVSTEQIVEAQSDLGEAALQENFAEQDAGMSDFYANWASEDVQEANFDSYITGDEPDYSAAIEDASTSLDYADSSLDESAAADGYVADAADDLSS